MLDTVDAARWNQRIASLNGPMQLTTEWASFVCAKDRLQPLFLERDNGDVAIVYLASSSLWPFSRWPAASADCIPLACDRTRAIADIELILRRRGVSEFQLNSFAYGSAVPLHLAHLGYAEVVRYEFVLSLDQAIDVAWRGTRPTVRNDIRRFERSGVICCIRSERGVVSELYDIEQETASRHRAQGKQGNVMRAEIYDALWEMLVSTGRVRIYVAYKAGVPIASVVIGACGTNAYYLYGGATLDGLALNAPKGLLWFAIQQEYAAGVRKFNLGGMPATAADPASLDHGLYRFKTGFGAIERSCISGKKILRPGLLTAKAGLRNFVHRVRGGVNDRRDGQ